MTFNRETLKKNIQKMKDSLGPEFMEKVKELKAGHSLKIWLDEDFNINPYTEFEEVGLYLGEDDYGACPDWGINEHDDEQWLLDLLDYLYLVSPKKPYTERPWYEEAEHFIMFYTSDQPNCYAARYNVLKLLACADEIDFGDEW